MQLSVLDQSIANAGKPQSEAISDSLTLAKICDTLGFHRYWVSEHHNSDGIVGTAPEILMSAIAATTDRIRIGSAGVMLPHYASLKVAEQFRVLEAIAPGRIDMGLGRAPGSDRTTAMALNPNAGVAHEQFPQQVVELMHWVSGKPLPEGHPFSSIGAHPQGPTSPEIWMLGSSDYGARLGAQLGLPYAFAYFFTDGIGSEQAMALYRHLYKPSERHPKPSPTLCVWALVAESEEEAWFHYRSREHWKVRMEQGIREALQPPESLVDTNYSPAEKARMVQLRQSALVGTLEQVSAKMEVLAGNFELEELVVVTWTFDPTIRHRSCELLASHFLSG